jgi:hypothetical protein
MSEHSNPRGSLTSPTTMIPCRYDAPRDTRALIDETLKGLA